MQLTLKPKSVICLLLATGVSVSACGSSGHKWDEEVQLSDRQVIVVERETLVERGGDEWASNRSGKKPREYRIRFAVPSASGQTIEWRSTKKTPREWPEKPLILDVEAGQAIVFASVYMSAGCEVYLKYRYQDGKWVEELLPEEFEQRPTNLLIRDGMNMPKFVALPEKRKWNAEPNYRRSLKYVGPRRKICG